MSEEEKIALYEECTDELLIAFGDISVIERLRFVANVISKRALLPTQPGYDPMIPVLSDILHEAIAVLVENVPQIHELRYRAPKPDPS